MILFDKVWHQARDSVGLPRSVLVSVDLVIPANRRIALMGDPFEHTRTVIDLAAGLISPSAGRVVRKALVSFPAGETTMFIPEISVRGNIKHIARLHGADHQAVVRFAQVVMDIGSKFDKPYGSLPRDIRKILSHIIAYCIPFQTYVLIEPLKSGKGGLTDVARGLLSARTKTCGLIAPIRDLSFAEEFCESAVVLRNSRLYAFETIGDAIRMSRRAD